MYTKSVVQFLMAYKPVNQSAVLLPEEELVFLYEFIGRIK